MAKGTRARVVPSRPAVGRNGGSGFFASAGLTQGLPTVQSVITSDAFTGGDIANIEGRNTDLSSGGSAKTWLASTAGSGIGISSGRLARTSGSSQRRVGFDAGSGDIYARCKVYENAGVFGAPIVQIRRTDVSTVQDSYRVEVDSAGAISVRKGSGGGSVTLYSHPAPAVAGTEVGVFAKGSLVGCTVNSRVVFTCIDADHASSRTFFAFQVQTGALLVDDLVISQL